MPMESADAQGSSVFLDNVTITVARIIIISNHGLIVLLVATARQIPQLHQASGCNVRTTNYFFNSAGTGIASAPQSLLGKPLIPQIKPPSPARTSAALLSTSSPVAFTGTETQPLDASGA